MNEVWKKPPVSFEAYQAMVGQEIGVSSWHLVDQARINVYADVIEDHQFIHVDPERAKKETAFYLTKLGTYGLPKGQLVVVAVGGHLGPLGGHLFGYARVACSDVGFATQPGQFREAAQT